VVDETGDLKKGTHSVGVQRQYTGTAGRIENSQVAVYLAYAAPTGHALIDRALYLPQSWTERPDRCTDAGIPPGTQFATKPALATAMITAALDADTPASWVAGDEVYGADPTLRATLESRGVGYVLAVASNRRVPTANGPLQVDFLAAALPTRSWQRLSAGGRGFRSTPVQTGNTGCCCAATTPPKRSPTTVPSHPGRRRSVCWSRSPANAGASRNASKPAKG
jgi:SRSO17 transposase